MNLNQLECFVRCVETKSFSDVAQQLFLTQPAVTYQITALEKEFGVNLFYRTRQGILPTKPGQVLYERAKEMLSLYGTMQEDVRKATAGSDSFLRIGFTRLPNDLELTSMLFQYSRENGDVSLDVNIDSVVETSREMDEGHYDLIFDYKYDEREYSGMEFVPLGTETFYVLMSVYHPLAGRSGLHIEDLKGSTVLQLSKVRTTRFQVPSLEELSRAGAEISTEDFDHDRLIVAVAAGRGVNIYPSRRRTDMKGLRCVPLVSVEPLRFGMLYKPENASPALLRLVDFLKENYSGV